MVEVQHGEVFESEDYYIMKDTRTGCEYVKAYGTDSGWTYVHGTCPDVLRKESN